MKKEISENDRFEGVRVMLQLTKKEIRTALGINQYTYNEICQNRKPLPSTWLNYMHAVYSVNTQFILHGEGEVLC